MRRPTTLDWLGAAALWAGASGAFSAYLHLGTQMPDDISAAIGFGLFFAGVGAGRLWWLRRADPNPEVLPRVGMSTGEMTAQRLAEMEARIYELEERLELSERLLMEATREPRRSHVREVTPV